MSLREVRAQIMQGAQRADRSASRSCSTCAPVLMRAI